MNGACRIVTKGRASHNDGFFNLNDLFNLSLHEWKL
jgi:hypothetical protein